MKARAPYQAALAVAQTAEHTEQECAKYEDEYDDTEHGLYPFNFA